MSSPDERRLAIASRLKAAREQAGLTQAQVAKILGLHRPSISEIEAGRRSVSAEELVTLAETYGVSVALAHRDGEQILLGPGSSSPPGSSASSRRKTSTGSCNS